MKLSKRLSAVSNHISCTTLIDIGSDHAKLPCFAVKNGLCKTAIAGEVAIGPFLAAKTQVEKLQLENKISVRLGNGLEVIADNEGDTLSICGMGGSLITEILLRGKNKLTSINRLILQPNVSEVSVRAFLSKNGWEIIAEEILVENDKIYEIIIAQKGQMPELSNIELLSGRFLSREKSALFIKKWQQELVHLKKIAENLKNGQPSPKTVQKQQELDSTITLLTELLE